MSGDVEASYRAFVAALPKRDDGYLFDQPTCRFWPEPTDELVAPPGARAIRVDDHVVIRLANGASLPLGGIGLERAEAALSVLPCRYSRLMVALGSDCDSFVEQTFSRVLFAPGAIAALELALPSSEIVRFPGSPYEVVRAYWQNSVHARKALIESGLPTTAEDLQRLLLEMHRRLLLGAAGNEGRSSFYLPASALAQKRVTPGVFYETEAATEQRADALIITRGARVSAPLLGGTHYWQLLAESVSDPDALTDSRHVHADGLDLGRLVRARAEEETELRPWFLPPRPLTLAHFAALSRDLAEAARAEAARDVAGVLSALGAFHFRFVRTHPLPSGNQSLSMNIVGWMLSRVLGAGMPHLLMDQLALRFELAPYQRLFARAARAWTWPDATGGASKAERLRQLLRMRGELNDFVRTIAGASSLLEARALIDTPAAELALLTSDAPGARGW
jgi:hypothetical protein